MRHPWLILAAIVATSQVSPELILARRLEQKALFAQRMGRVQVAHQEMEMAHIISGSTSSPRTVHPVRPELVEGHKGEKL